MNPNFRSIACLLLGVVIVFSVKAQTAKADLDPPTPARSAVASSAAPNPDDPGDGVKLCGLHERTGCEKSRTKPCKKSCGAGPYPACPCPMGNGSCEGYKDTACYGKCPKNEKCNTEVADCKCVPNKANAKFDDHRLSRLCTQSDWEEWIGKEDVCGDVVNMMFEEGVPAHSGEQALQIIGQEGGSSGLGDDVVWPMHFDGEVGPWTFSIQTFVPLEAVGQAWIVLLNQYPDNMNWSLQVRLSADDGMIVADYDGECLPLIRGRWVEFRAEIDLDADIVDYFYNGEQFVFGKSWVDGVSGGGLPQIQALGLYGDEPFGQGTSGTYFDDVTFTAADIPCEDIKKAKFKCKRGKLKIKIIMTDSSHAGKTMIVDYTTGAVDLIIGGKKKAKGKVMGLSGILDVSLVDPDCPQFDTRVNCG